MYTVVSLSIDLAGEPDTIDFTLVLVSRFTVLFFFYCYRFLGRRLIVSLGVFLKNALTLRTLTRHIVQTRRVIPLGEE